MTAQAREQFIGYLAMILNVDDNMGKLMSVSRRRGAGGEHDPHLLDRQRQHIRLALLQRRNAREEDRVVGRRPPRSAVLVRWPGGGFGSARDVEGVTQVQDLLPTLIELAGLVTPSAPRFDGISLAPVLRGRAAVPSERMVVINYSRMPIGFDYPSPVEPVDHAARGCGRALEALAVAGGPRALRSRFGSDAAKQRDRRASRGGREDARAFGRVVGERARDRQRAAAGRHRQRGREPDDADGVRVVGRLRRPTGARSGAAFARTATGISMSPRPGSTSSSCAAGRGRRTPPLASGLPAVELTQGGPRTRRRVADCAGRGSSSAMSRCRSLWGPRTSRPCSRSNWKPDRRCCTPGSTTRGERRSRAPTTSTSAATDPAQSIGAHLRRPAERLVLD